MGQVTQILEAIEKGDDLAAELLLPIVYEELRRLASRKISHEKPQTLDRLKRDGIPALMDNIADEEAPAAHFDDVGHGRGRSEPRHHQPGEDGPHTPCAHCSERDSLPRVVTT